LQKYEPQNPAIDEQMQTVKTLLAQDGVVSTTLGAEKKYNVFLRTHENQCKIQ